MKLLLIRHAQSEGNAARRIQGRSEYPLSELGREQARLLASRLSTEFKEIVAIYSSSQDRAMQTAETLAQALNVAVIPDDRLREYDIGELTGLTMEEVRERFPEIHARWMEDTDEWIDFPGSEDHAGFHRRVRGAFADIAASHKDETVVAVSHGGTLGTYLSQIVGLEPGKKPPFYFDNTSITIVDLSRKRPRLARQNDTCHLRDMGGE